MTSSTGARFKLHLTCTNCLRQSAKLICCPPVEDAPQDVDELVGSAFLGSQRFLCSQCDSTIAEIVGADQIYDEVAA